MKASRFLSNLALAAFAVLIGASVSAGPHREPAVDEPTVNALGPADALSESDLVDSGDGSGGIRVVNCGGEALCRLFVQLARVMDGQAPNDWPIIDQHTSYSVDQMFNGGGSQNHAVIAHTVRYYYNGSIASRDWLWNYYVKQFQPGRPYFLDREVFSSVYTQGVVGAALVVRKRAHQLGHAGLRDKAAQFLRHYWAYLGLAAAEPRPTTWIAYNKHGTVTKQLGELGWGYNLGLVGRRVYSNGFGGSPDSLPGTGQQGVLLAMALQHPDRATTADLRESPAYWGGLRAAVEAAGYQLDGSGKVNLQSQSVAPEFFGLTAAQRDLLRNFIANQGGSGVGNVIALLGNQQVSNDITIIRTHWGVISWFGKSGVERTPPGDAKGGPWYIARSLRAEDKTAFVTRSTDKWGSPPQNSTVWRAGNEICAKGPPGGLPQKCLAIPGETPRYEVVIGPTGTVCVAGTTCSSPPPPPPPCPGPIGDNRDPCCDCEAPGE